MQNAFKIKNISFLEAIEQPLPTEKANAYYKYSLDLGLLQPNQNPSKRHAWEIKCKPPEALHELPPKLPHAGKYEWLGHQNLDPPKWLWDSLIAKTVPATEGCLRKGYIAVSYTWGRWKVGEEMRDGTSWAVPVVD